MLHEDLARYLTLTLRLVGPLKCQMTDTSNADGGYSGPGLHTFVRTHGTNSNDASI